MIWHAAREAATARPTLHAAGRSAGAPRPQTATGPQPAGKACIPCVALALLLAGPALSLQSMLVLRTVMGTRKTIVYVSLVIVMATVTGLVYGVFVE